MKDAINFLIIVLLVKDIASIVHLMEGYFSIASESTIYNSVVLNPLQYYVPTVKMCIGRPLQCFNLAITTESAYSFLANKSDEPVFRNPFDVNQSSTVNEIPLSTRIMVYYQFYMIKGRVVKDYFSFKDNTSSSINPISFVLLEEYESITQVPYDGFIGMGRDNNPFYLKDSNYIDEAISLSFNLYDSFGIKGSNRQFALRYYFNYTGEFFLNENFDISASYCKVPRKEKTKWFCEARSLQIANESFVFREAKNAFFYSTGNIVSIPLRYSEKITKHILTKSNGLCRMDTINEVGIFFCDPSMDLSQLSDVEIVFSHGRLTMKWCNLMRIIAYERKQMYISLLIVESNWYDAIEIGIPAFLDNLIVFDAHNERIGFLKAAKYKNALGNYLKSVYICVILQYLIGLTLLLFLLQSSKLK